MLKLADLKDMTDQEVKEHILRYYSYDDSSYNYDGEHHYTINLDQFEILIAYESVGDYGCDSASFFLLKMSDGSLWEVHGSHCSCYGFENQWQPEQTNREYLLSDKFYFTIGGYDYDPNLEIVKNHLKSIL